MTKGVRALRSIFGHTAGRSAGGLDGHLSPAAGQTHGVHQGLVGVGASGQYCDAVHAQGWGGVQSNAGEEDDPSLGASSLMAQHFRTREFLEKDNSVVQYLG